MTCKWPSTESPYHVRSVDFTPQPVHIDFQDPGYDNLGYFMLVILV